MRAYAQVDGPRWLRWAWVEDGRIVREARIGPDAVLTAGQGADVPAHGEPRPLAHFRDGAWRLELRDGLSGRIGERAIGDASGHELALGDDARGRIEVDGRVVLLQVIERPPRQRAAPLPAALRAGIFERADWWFTAFVTASFVLHFAFVAFVLESDWPIDRAPVPARMITIFYPHVEPPPDAPVERMDGDMPADVTEDDVEADAPAEDRERRVETARAPRSPSSQPRLDADARAATEAALERIGALMPAGSSAFGAVLNGESTHRAAELMDSVRAPGALASTDPGVLDERGGDTTPCTGDECLGNLRGIARGGRPIRAAPVEEVRVVVQPAPGGLDVPAPPPDFDPRALSRAIRARMSAIRRCYEHELTTGDPDAAGRLTVTMRVMPVGTLEGVRILENETGSIALEACVIRSLARVRVRPGPSEPVDATYPIVFVPRM